jgi:8-oxo-dGTP pyrophosphatase MutT (NUDIX family)
MGGFHSFPGGQLDKDDSAITVSGCDGEDAAKMRACAIREMFEEAGVLVVRGADKLSPARLAEKRRALEDGTRSFKELLEEDQLSIEAPLLVEAGRWVTPPFAPRRYDTSFFLSWLPEGQEPTVEVGELEIGEWIRPADALEGWKRGESIMAPPTLFIIRTLAANHSDIHEIAKALTSIPEAHHGLVRRLEVRAGMFLFPAGDAYQLLHRGRRRVDRPRPRLTRRRRTEGTRYAHR